MALFELIEIDRIIIHKIFKRTSKELPPPPIRSDKLTVLDMDDTNRFIDRLVRAFGKNSHSVEMTIVETDNASHLQLTSRIIHSEECDFITHTHDVVNNLVSSQDKGSIPGGIIICISGKLSIDKLNYFCVIKAEEQEGYAIESLNDETILLKFLSELILTPAQKLYKIGVFVEVNELTDPDLPRKNHEFRAFIFDHMISRKDERKAAYYFYHDFLGCDFLEDDKVYTRNFYEVTSQFINRNTELTDTEKHLAFSGLYSYLHARRNQVVDPKEFVKDYFESEEIQKNLLNEYQVNKIPLRAFSKEVSLLHRDINNRRIQFTTNVRLDGPYDKFDENVSILNHEKLVQLNEQGFDFDRNTLVRIKGRIQYEK